MKLSSDSRSRRSPPSRSALRLARRGLERRGLERRGLERRGTDVRALFRCVLGVGLGWIVGCGGPTAVETTIDDDTLGQDFSAAEAEEFCRALESYATSQLAAGLGCKSFGVTAAVSLLRGRSDVDEATLRQTCEAAREDCAAAEATSLNCAAAVAITPCAATVADLESCLTDEIDERAESLRDLPECGALTVATVRTLLERSGECPALPSSCTVVGTSCEAALGSYGRAVRGLTVSVGNCR